MPRLARGQRAAPAPAERRHPRGLRRAPRVGARRSSTPRYAVVSWPEEYGGRDASLWEWLIFEEEYYRAGAPQRVTQNGIFLLAPTIFEFGTDGAEGPHPARRWRRASRRGARAGRSRTRAATSPASSRSAVRDDAAGGWRLSGQKTWTTRGAFCTHLFGLFRSDPDGRAAPRPHVLPRRPRRRRA